MVTTWPPGLPDVLIRLCMCGYIHAGLTKDAGYFVSEEQPPAASCTTFGTSKSIYSPLSPLAPWTLTITPFGAVDLSNVTEVLLEFRGSKAATEPQADNLLQEYCDVHGYQALDSGSARAVTDVTFVAGRQNCPLGTQLVPGNLNAGIGAAQSVYACVNSAPALLATAVVSDIVLVQGNSSVQQVSCPAGHKRVGVDLNLGECYMLGMHAGHQEVCCLCLLTLLWHQYQACTYAFCANYYAFLSP
jgi:hypothetical protein